MSATGESTVFAAEEHADAIAADALAAAAGTAVIAAQQAVANQEQTAAHLQAAAAEHAAAVEESVAENITAQEDELAWLKTHAAQTTERLEAQTSALTAQTERMERVETALSRALELLTPPPSQNPQAEAVTVPEEIPGAQPTPPSAEGDAPKVAEETPAQGRKRHRWI
jgi:hypothetical protein